MTPAEKLARALELIVRREQLATMIAAYGSAARPAEAAELEAITKEPHEIAAEALAAWRSQQAAMSTDDSVLEAYAGKYGERPSIDQPGLYRSSWDIGLSIWTEGFERGRQRGMEQAHALNELAMDGQEVQPLTEAQAIKLWRENVDAHSRVSAFEWFAAGLIAAERHHGIGTTPPAGDSDTKEN